MHIPLLLAAVVCLILVAVFLRDYLARRRPGPPAHRPPYRAQAIRLLPPMPQSDPHPQPGSAEIHQFPGRAGRPNLPSPYSEDDVDITTEIARLLDLLNRRGYDGPELFEDLLAVYHDRPTTPLPDHEETP